MKGLQVVGIQESKMREFLKTFNGVFKTRNHKRAKNKREKKEKRRKKDR